MAELFQDSAVALETAAAITNLNLQRIGFRPSCDDIQEIHDSAHLLRDILGRIGDYITNSARPKDVHALLSVQSKVSAQSDIDASLLSPIHRLLPEVLSEIFLFASKSMPDSHQLRTASILARVSTFWRHVARTTPRLWNLLFNASARDIDQYYNYYLELARDIPLRAHCTGATTTLLLLLDSPQHSRHRFTSVQLATPVNLRRPWSYENRMPYLEDLSIDVVYPDFAPATGYMDREVMYFLATPKLKSLTINVRGWNFYRELNWEHPCTTLTSLTIVADDEEGILDFLPVQTLLPQCSQSLERIDIDVGLAYTSHYREQMDFMPRLAVIKMGHSDCELLRCIEAPSVKVISFSSPHTNFVGDLLSFSSKASTFQLLRRLEISQWRGDREEGKTLARCMEAMVHLEELCITESFVPLELVRALTCVEDKQPLLPRLLRLTLVNLENEDELYDALKEVHASRRGVDIICQTVNAVV